MFFNTDKKNTVKDAKLTEYSNSSSGDMCGSFQGISISLFDNGTYVSFSSQAYPPHYAGILHKISEIITKYKESFKEFKRTGK